MPPNDYQLEIGSPETHVAHPVNLPDRRTVMTHHSHRVSAMTCAGHYEEALATSRRAAGLRSDPFLPNLGEQALLLAMLGRSAEAVEVARAIRQNPGTRTRWSADADAIWTLEKAGLENEATQYANELATRPASGSYIRGFALTSLGRFEEALPFLAQTPVITWRELYWDPRFDSYREDPRFQQLLVKLNWLEEYKVAREILARMLKEQEEAKK